MKKCLAIAVLLLASSLTTAQAQYSFEYGGRTITIDPDRGTVQIPGVYDNTGKKAKRPRGEEGDLDRPVRKTPQQAKSAPQAAPETTPRLPRRHRLSRRLLRRRRLPPLLRPLPPRCSGHAVDRRRRPWRPLMRRAPPAAPQAAPAPPPPAPAPVAAPAPLPPQQKQAAAPATSAPSSANSPLGVWLTEEKEGKVRIEAMRPQPLRLFRRQEVEPERRAGSDQHEARQGQVERPDFRSEFRQHLQFHDRAEGHRQLRVQGCAFGGMFCGGQTWTRVN